MFDSLATQIGAVFMALVCAFAFLKGEEAERVGAITYLLSWFASLAVQTDNNLFSVQWSMFAIDLVVLGVFILLIWKGKRLWASWATAFQSLVVMSHLLSVLDVRPAQASYYTVINLAGYCVLLCLAVGAFLAWQERRAAGLE